jgi:hypothetical protein
MKVFPQLRAESSVSPAIDRSSEPATVIGRTRRKRSRMRQYAFTSWTKVSLASVHK